MKSLGLLALAILASGCQRSVASTLSYDFSFHQLSPLSEAGFSYKSEGPTLPGTNLNDLLRVMYPGPFPSVSGFRDGSGAWSFTEGFLTTSFTYVALTDTTFANLPGFYEGL